MQQLPTFAGTAYDQIVLMDCDTAWVGTAELPIGAPVASRIVDAANPPERILLTTGASAGLVATFTALFAAGDRVALARPGYELGDRVLAELSSLWPSDRCCSV